MNSYDNLIRSLNQYCELAESKRRNPAKIAEARAILDRALAAHKAALFAPPPHCTSADPAAVPCPVCDRPNDTRWLTTGNILWCQCAARLEIWHQADGLTRVTLAGRG